MTVPATGDPAAPPVPGPPAQATGATTDPPSDTTDWKAEARKWETRSKENLAAADRLKAIEEASKSEEQKANDRAAAAEKTATEAQAKVLRRDLAIEHKLSKDDVALLDGILDENALTALAGRLAKSAGTQHGNVAPFEGGNPTPSDSNAGMRSFTRGLFKAAEQS